MKTIKENVPALFGDRKLTATELWALVKMFRVVRLRCRNNSALNNQLNSAFPYARFRQVPKQHPDGTKYEGLEIVVPLEGATVGD